MPGWLWFVVGLGLLALELFVPSGFYLLLVGVGALVTGAIAQFGLNEPFWLQAVIFAVATVTLVVVFREKLLCNFGSDSPESSNDLIGAEMEIGVEIAPGGLGEGVLRGSTWKVRNTRSGKLLRGERVRVVGVDGVTLVV